MKSKRNLIIVKNDLDFPALMWYNANIFFHSGSDLIVPEIRTFFNIKQ